MIPAPSIVLVSRSVSFDSYEDRGVGVEGGRGDLPDMKSHVVQSYSRRGRPLQLPPVVLNVDHREPGVGRGERQRRTAYDRFRTVAVDGPDVRAVVLAEAQRAPVHTCRCERGQYHRDGTASRLKV